MHSQRRSLRRSEAQRPGLRGEANEIRARFSRTVHDEGAWHPSGLGSALWDEETQPHDGGKGWMSVDRLDLRSGKAGISSVIEARAR